MIVAALATYLALHPAAYGLAQVARTPTWRSLTLLIAYVLVLASLPFQFVPGDHFLRAAAATVAVSYSIKVCELLRGKPRDRSILHSFPRFVLWMMVPHDPRWPAEAALRASNRRLGVLRVGRASAKGLLVAIVALLGPVLHDENWPYAVSSVVTAFHFYFFATAITDSVAALGLLSGASIDEIFSFPFLARSPADFWSRRWNVYIARFGARYIFAPLHRRGIVLATVAVFAASGLMHEYIVLAIFGLSKTRLGYMSAFFGLQCVGVLAQHAWLRATRRRFHLREGLAVALHLLWFVPTTVLFFAPVGSFLHDWGIVWRAPPW